MIDVAALGECLIDFTPNGENAQGIALFARNPGGAPANVLAMNARLGGKTAFIGKVGRDGFGDFLRQTLLDSGIDVSGLAVDEKVTCAIFHFGSVSMTADPCRTATLSAARYARQKGKLVSFDPNYRPLLWDDTEEAVLRMKEGIRLADILKVSEEEMQLVTGESDPERGSKALLDMGPSLVLVSMGAKGAYCRNAVCAGALPTFDVPTVDTTGAGDAFMGAIHFLLKGKTAEELRALPEDALREIVRFGNAAGSLTTTKGGAIPAMPSMEEIRSCIASAPLL